MASVKVATSMQWESQPLPPLHMETLMPRLDVGGITDAIQLLWAALAGQQRVTAELAAALQRQKAEAAAALDAATEQLGGVVASLREELRTANEAHRAAADALREQQRASDREHRDAVAAVAASIDGRVAALTQQVSHAALVANTALDPWNTNACPPRTGHAEP